MSSSTTCKKCLSAFSAAGIKAMIEARPGYIHHVPEELEASARRGCDLCQLILEQEMLGRVDDDTSYEYILLFAEEDEPGDSSFMTTLAIWPYPREDMYADRVVLNLSIFTLESSPISSFFTSRPIETDVMAPRVIEEAKKTIAECQKSHAPCGNSDSLPRLPARVLDVSEAPSSTIRLYVTKRTGEYDHYVTLSYCWGGPQPVVATKATLKQLQNGMPIASLPQTLQDAVRVTRALGFRYLWVDALCIVQDDDVDKMSEIGNMDQVYGNCTLTISAAVAETVYEGFVKYPREEPYVTIPAELPNGKRGDVFIAPCLEAEFSELPLQMRGWTLQEWLLPPRILFYGDRELVYQCRTAGTRAVCPSYMSYETANKNTGRIVDHRLQVPDAAERGRRWVLFMREYSARKLTVASDRMHAMTGIRKALSSSWQDETVAGLWKSTFPFCLAWECRVRVQPAPKGRTGYAPSWSWLSIDTPVTADLDLFFGFDMADAQVLAVSEHELKLRCRVIPVDIPDREYYKDIESEAKGKKELGLFLGIVFEREATNKAKLLVVVEDDSRKGAFRRVGIASWRRFYDWKPYEKQDVTII